MGLGLQNLNLLIYIFYLMAINHNQLLIAHLYLLRALFCLEDVKLNVV